jgi:ribonuclease D
MPRVNYDGILHHFQHPGKHPYEKSTGWSRWLRKWPSRRKWREREAQRKDLPRNRVLRDEALVEIAAHAPTNADDLGRTRGLGSGMAQGRYGTEILAAVQTALSIPDAKLPRPEPRVEPPPGIAPIVELLRVLLKMVCDDSEVASRLVANSADLEAIAGNDDADVPALKGWRRDLFGEAALKLKRGKLALAIAGKKVKLVELDK